MSDRNEAHRPGPAQNDRDRPKALCELVSLTVGGQLFGIPVLQVRDVLGPQRMTRVPLAAPEVAGSLNLRGRIVTAIDLSRRLGIVAESRPDRMSVVVDHAGELYSLLVDTVGEVLNPGSASFEPNPPTLDPLWRDVAAGVYRLDAELLVVLDISRILGIGRSALGAQAA